MAGKWKYEIIIYWSGEDQSYLAEVPEQALPPDSGRDPILPERGPRFRCCR